MFQTVLGDKAEDDRESLLKEQCDPESYTRVLGEFVARLDDMEINTEVGIHEIRLGLKMYWLRLTEGIIASGKYDEALDITFYLGQVYLHNGDAARVKEAFEYVISHGNKLHIADEAKKLFA